MDDTLRHPHDAEDDGFESFLLPDDGTFPNNPRLPVVLYREAILFETSNHAAEIEARYRDNGWQGIWHNGIFTWHHYHATAHEVLGIAQGTVTVQLGGDEGPLLELSAGDIVSLPAGTTHKNIDASHDLLVIGAYPPGQSPDMKDGSAGERPESDRQIAAVPIPASDPVLGKDGPLLTLWRG